MTTTKVNTKQPTDPPPAQCTETRHIYDTANGRIVSDVCRCKQRRLKKMQ